MQAGPRSVSFCIFDLDETVFPHWPGLDEGIGEIIHDIILHMARNVGQNPSLKSVEAKAEESYMRYGLPMLIPAQIWGFGHVEAHRLYHRRTLDEIVYPQFEDKAAAHADFYAEFREQLREGKSLGMRHSLLTHGDNDWAQEVPVLLGVDAEIPFRRGICGYDMQRKCTDPALYARFLREAEFWGAFEQVAMFEDREPNLYLPSTLGMLPVLVGQKPLVAHDKGIVCHADVTKAMPDILAHRRAWLEYMADLGKPRVCVRRPAI